MKVWKIIVLSKWVICRFHVNLLGCIPHTTDIVSAHITTATPTPPAATTNGYSDREVSFGLSLRSNPVTKKYPWRAFATLPWQSSPASPAGATKNRSTSWLALRGVLGTLMVKLLFVALYFLLSHTNIMFHIVLPRIENSTTQWSQCSTVMNSLARAAAAVESLSPLSSIWWGMCTEHKEHLFGAFLQCNLKANVKCPNRRSMVSDNQIISK